MEFNMTVDDETNFSAVQEMPASIIDLKFWWNNKELNFFRLYEIIHNTFPIWKFFAPKENMFTRELPSPISRSIVD